MKIICSILFLVVNLFCIAQEPATVLKQIMEKYKAVGLAIVVVKDNHIVYDTAFGYKNVDEKALLTNKDIFRIASISKSFSATAIMQLVGQKKLSLKADVSKLVGFTVRNPKFPNQPITLEMLLSHRSSINDSRGYFTLDSLNPVTSINWQNSYSAYAPGSRYQYCNFNFNLIGAIIERVSGERFDQYIKTHILDPLGLYGGYDADNLDKSLFANLYEYDSASQNYNVATDAYASKEAQLKNYTLGYSTPIFSPTGGMKISATDLAKYMVMHMNFGKGNGKRIIPEKLSKLMQKPISHELGYAMAIMNFDDLVEGTHLTGHTGTAYGLYSAMFFNPQKKFGFVVITNGCNAGDVDAVNPISKDCLQYLYKTFISE